MRFDDYIELLRCTSEAVRDDKDGCLSERADGLLSRLGIATEHWVQTVQTFHQSFAHMVGQTHHMDAHCKRLGIERTKGSNFARRAFLKRAS